jgi:predicted dehydrogenase
MKKKVRLAVLGVGSWTAVNHLPLLLSRDDVDLVAAVDSSEERRRTVERRYPFDLVTDDPEEALAQDIDAVVIGATRDAHHSLASAALRHGCDVLCEKPFTRNASEAWDLVEQARAAGRELIVPFGWNYMPIAARARELAREHSIGTVEHVQIHMATALREIFQGDMSVWETNWGRPADLVPLKTSMTTAEKGAGYAWGQISHALALLLYIYPIKAETAFAFMASPGSTVDLHDAIALQLDGGGTASISGACSPVGANENKHQLDIRVFGSDGQFILDLDRELCWLYKRSDVDIKLDLQEGDGAYDCSAPVNVLIDHVLGLPAENCSPGELAAQTTQILEAAYASRASGLPQPVPQGGVSTATQPVAGPVR